MTVAKGTGKKGKGKGKAPDEDEPSGPSGMSSSPRFAYILLLAVTSLSPPPYLFPLSLLSVGEGEQRVLETPDGMLVDIIVPRGDQFRRIPVFLSRADWNSDDKLQQSQLLQVTTKKYISTIKYRTYTRKLSSIIIYLFFKFCYVGCDQV